MRTKTEKRRLPVSTVERLCRIYGLCEQLIAEHHSTRVTSKAIANHLGVSADLVRRDISYLGEVGSTGTGYDVKRLRDHLGNGLGLGLDRKACVVGLGALGAVLLTHERFTKSGYRIVAGFDTSINRLETIRTNIPLFPAYEMADVVRSLEIELAMLAVPASAAQYVAETLAGAGVVCLLNFAPVVVRVRDGRVVVRNVDILNELHVVSALERLVRRLSGREDITEQKRMRPNTAQT